MDISCRLWLHFKKYTDYSNPFQPISFCFGCNSVWLYDEAGEYDVKVSDKLAKELVKSGAIKNKKFKKQFNEYYKSLRK